MQVYNPWSVQPNEKISIQMDGLQISLSFPSGLSKCTNNLLALGFFQIPRDLGQTTYNCASPLQIDLGTQFQSKMRKMRGTHVRISHFQCVLACIPLQLLPKILVGDISPLQEKKKGKDDVFKASRKVYDDVSLKHHLIHYHKDKYNHPFFIIKLILCI